jgi:5-(carboxyamino)imidazole ribonucleotide synthase
MIAPGGTIGILGGGQLGRMLGVAAAQLGYRTHVLAPDRESVAAQTASSMTRADYHNRIVLADFAAACDVVTYEFENIALAPVEWLAERVPVHPHPRALAAAQERVAEKRFVESVGGRPARWAAVDSLATLEAAVAQVGTPAVLKTARFGYDGKGQVRLSSPADATDAWAAIGGPAVLEAFVPFEHEFSVLIVRGQDGDTRRYDAPLNVHRDAILRTSTLPAPPNWSMSACSPASSSRRPRGRCSTRWRRASTTAATGRSRERKPRSSRTISARSAACRWGRPR